MTGAAIAHHVFGQGPPCIAIPGGPGLEWSYLRMPALDPHVTMIHIEPVGTGASPRLDGVRPYSRARDVADVEGLRRALGLDRVFVLGHSYGGSVALEYALAYPEHLAGLVVYDTVARYDGAWVATAAHNLERYRGQPWFDDALAAWRAGGADDDDEATRQFHRYLPFYFHDYRADQARYDAAFAAVRVSRSRQIGDGGERFDVTDRLASIRAPTLIIVGASDFIDPPAAVADMHRRIPGARLVVLARSGHFGHLEEPEAFAAVVAGFVQARGTSSAACTPA